MAGIARGRRIVAPRGEVTRPTSDFVREAIFNSVNSHLRLEQAEVLDLFAGTGAMGIEALSRGARHATFVESDGRAVDAVRTNLATLGFEDLATVVAGDATRVELPDVDVAFVDPPYAFDGWELLLGRIRAGVAVLESDRELDLGDRWRVLKLKKYGTTVVTLTSSGLSCPPERDMESPH